jgi:hypothetical protein
VAASLEIRLLDLFAFGDGRTVLAGEVIAGPDYIGPMTCELWVADTKCGILKIEGEMLGGKHPKGYRAVSTWDAVAVDRDQILEHPCMLRAVDPEE